MKHTQLSTARLRFLFLAAKIWSHSGRVGVRYSDQYEEKGLFQRFEGSFTNDPERRRPVRSSDTNSSSLLTTVVHRILCTRNEAVPTYIIGRTPPGTIARELKQTPWQLKLATQSQRSICA